MIEHLGMLRRWRRGAILALLVCVVIHIRRRAIGRMILVLRALGHVWRRSAGRRGIELRLPLRGLLRGRIVVPLVHMVSLTWISHIEQVRSGHRQQRDEARRSDVPIALLYVGNTPRGAESSVVRKIPSSLHT
jgi:hypothetical protein